VPASPDVREDKQFSNSIVDGSLGQSIRSIRSSRALILSSSFCFIVSTASLGSLLQVRYLCGLSGFQAEMAFDRRPENLDLKGNYLFAGRCAELGVPNLRLKFLGPTARYNQLRRVAGCCIHYIELLGYSSRVAATTSRRRLL
jgi:hypothetical protein